MRVTARSACCLLLAWVASAPAVAAGGPRLQVFFAADFADAAYQQATFTKLAGAWKRPAESPKPGSKAVVITTIGRDGAVAGTRLHHESGSAAWDQAALEAVRKAAPFGALPKSYGRDTVEMHAHFELAP